MSPLPEEPCFDDLPGKTYPPLIITGERTLPDIAAENYWFQRHLFAYRELLPRVEGLRVLDLGCGEGYGADLLADRAAEVVALDLAPEAVYHARRKYRRPNLRFDYGDVCELPYAEGEFDAVVSLQVLEHLHEPDRYMAEIVRVLRVGGQAYLTTPNRLIISPGQDHPVCPFHVFEFDAAQFREYARRFFAEVDISGVFHGRRLAGFEPLENAPRDGWRRLLPQRLLQYWRDRRFVPRISTEDFRLGREHLDEALDFLAACTKTGD